MNSVTKDKFRLARTNIANKNKRSNAVQNDGNKRHMWLKSSKYSRAVNNVNMNEVKDKSNSMFTGKSVYNIVAADRTEKSQRQFNIAPQQFIVPQTKRHNYHGS